MNEQNIKYVVEPQYIQNIADAIREKNSNVSSVNNMTIDKMPQLIKNINIEEKEVNFWDYDGTLLYSYSFDEINAWHNEQDMPSGPFHEGLIFDGWNYTLEDIKKCQGFVDIGALYLVDDDETCAFHLHIKIASKAEEFEFCVCASEENGEKECFKIDWGDGTEAEIYNADTLNASQSSITHSYTRPDTYIIKCYHLNRAKIKYGDNYGGYSVIHQMEGKGSILRKVFCGPALTNIDSCVFYGAYSLETIALSSKIQSIGEYAFNSCYQLKALIIPRNLHNFGIDPDQSFEPGAVINGCSILSLISFPYSISGILLITYDFGYLHNYHGRIKIPQSISYNNGIGYGNFVHNYTSLNIIDFSNYNALPTLETSSTMFDHTYDYIIIVPKSLEEMWKNANNWIKFKDRITTWEDLKKSEGII